MTLGRDIQTWGGHAINDGNPFSAVFLSDSGDPATHEAQAVEVERPGAFPVHAYGQPLPKTIEVEVSIDSGTFADGWKTLQAWFDPALGRQYLVAEDADSNEQRLLCFPLRLDVAGGEAGTAGNIITVTLRVASPVWEDVTAEDDEQDVGEGGGEVLAWTLTNDGNARTPLQITVTPSVGKDPGNSWPTRRRVVIANRSERALDDPTGDGYPLLLCDLSALDDPITAGDDIRVVLNGEFIPHWIEGDLLWVNLRMRPRKTATLAANIDDNDIALSVDNFQGFERDRWPQQDFFFLDDEVLQYTVRDSDQMTVVRGALGSTAASHTAGATLYWVQFPYLSLLYGFTEADAPSAYTDRKPVIDLAASTNTEHQWPDTFFTSERRSRAFQRRFSDLGVGSQHIRQYGDGTSLVYENNQAAAGKPNHNDAVMEFPVPLVGPLELDEDVEQTMLLRGYVADSEGYETKLISQSFSDGPLTAESFSVPDNVSRLRLVGSVGVITGALDPTTGGANIASYDTPGTADPADPNIEVFQRFQGAGIKFTLDQDSILTGLILRIAASSMSAPSDTTLGVLILRDDGDQPGVNSNEQSGLSATPMTVIPWNLSVASLPTWDEVSDFSAVDATIIDYGLRVPVEAGTYWVVFSRDYGESGNILFNTAFPTGRNIVRQGQVNSETASGFLAVLTDETNPQEDAPLDNGDTIEVANIVAPLDSTRAPQIYVGDEEDIYFLDARLQNDDTEDYLDLFFLLALSNTLTIDTEAHTATDAETGLSVPWAVRPSNPERWLDLLADVNDFSWVETGDTGLVVASSWRARRH